MENKRDRSKDDSSPLSRNKVGKHSKQDRDSSDGSHQSREILEILILEEVERNDTANKPRSVENHSEPDSDSVGNQEEAKQTSDPESSQQINWSVQSSISDDVFGFNVEGGTEG